MALLDRDPHAIPAQIASARDKAHRAPFLMLAIARLRTLFGLHGHEQAVCCVNIGTVTQHRPVRLRPSVSDYVSELD